jgi:hypothetical protein
MSLLPLRGTLRQGGWRSGRNLGKTTSIDDVCGAEEVPRGCAGVEVSVEMFECLVKEEHEVLRKAELSMEADSENYLGGSSETICTTSDLTFTRKRSATA